MPITTSSFIRQLSDQNANGTVLGSSATDKIAFYTSSTNQPVAQPSGNAQAAITRGAQAGLVTVLGTTWSPANVQAATTLEYAFSTVLQASSIYQIASGDLLYINKPTSQAGLGVGNVRVSNTNNAGVTFSNLTATTITPTATQKYGIMAIRGMPTTVQALTPTSVAADSIAEQQFAVTGVRLGELVQVNKPSSQAGLDIVGVRVVANNVLGISYMNVTLAPITPTAENYTIFSLAGMDALNNLITVAAAVGTPPAIGAVITTEVDVVCTGIQTTDLVVGVSKPTTQSGLGVVNVRSQTSANALGIVYINATPASITPTASEVYSVLVNRPNPTAPVVNYTVALTPSTVPASSSAEQLFTVNGLVVGTAVWVNYQSPQNNLGIAGVRVSAANQLAINFCNTSAVSITPTAGATYVVGNFQQVIPDNSNAFSQTASPTDQAQSNLANAMRTAFGPTQLNLIAGA